MFRFGYLFSRSRDRLCIEGIGPVRLPTCTSRLASQVGWGAGAAKILAHHSESAMGSRGCPTPEGMGLGGGAGQTYPHHTTII